MNIEKMNKLFNILAEYKKDLTPEQELTFLRKKVGKAERLVKEELNKKMEDWSQK